jgi:hypothetical protein
MSQRLVIIHPNITITLRINNCGGLGHIKARVSSGIELDYGPGYLFVNRDNRDNSVIVSNDGDMCVITDETNGIPATTKLIDSESCVQVHTSGLSIDDPDKYIISDGIDILKSPSEISRIQIDLSPFIEILQSRVIERSPFIVIYRHLDGRKNRYFWTTGDGHKWIDIPKCSNVYKELSPSGTKFVTKDDDFVNIYQLIDDSITVSMKIRIKNLFVVSCWIDDTHLIGLMYNSKDSNDLIGILINTETGTYVKMNRATKKSKYIYSYADDWYQIDI